MRRTAISTLALIAMVSMTAMVLLLLAFETRRQYLPAVPPMESLAVLSLAIGTFAMGRSVRAYLRGDKPGLDPIRAARTFALAKAAAVSGAILFGRYLAAVLVAAGDGAIPAQRERLIAAAIAGICALLLAIAGLIVERWCQLPPPDGKLKSARETSRLPQISEPNRSYSIR